MFILQNNKLIFFPEAVRSCTTDPDPAIPSAVALGQKGRTSFYGFSDGLTLRQVGTRIPLSPSLGLSQRAETTLLNKSVEISTTTGRFCSRCHLYLSKNSKAACLPGQAAVSALITAFYLAIPWLTISRLVPDIHLIRSY